MRESVVAKGLIILRDLFETIIFQHLSIIYHHRFRREILIDLQVEFLFILVILVSRDHLQLLFVIPLHHFMNASFFLLI